MSLNLKNPDVERLAHQVARVTGESLTRAVAVALEERLERLTGRGAGIDVARVQGVQAFLASLPRLDARSEKEVTDELWGDPT